MLSRSPSPTHSCGFTCFFFFFFPFAWEVQAGCQERLSHLEGSAAWEEVIQK